MNYPIFFNSKNSINLFGLEKNFKLLSNLYLKKKLPKVLMFSVEKSVGKSTLVNHFLFSIFDIKNYDMDKNTLKGSSNFINQFKNNIFENVVYLNGSDFKSVKIDEIRKLKAKIFQSTILAKDRFIILPPKLHLKKEEIYKKNVQNLDLKDNFKYSSDTNTEWLTRNQFLELLKE